jgi:hypothetical protein
MKELTLQVIPAKMLCLLSIGYSQMSTMIEVYFSPASDLLRREKSLRDNRLPAPRHRRDHWTFNKKTGFKFIAYVEEKLETTEILWPTDSKAWTLVLRLSRPIPVDIAYERIKTAVGRTSRKLKVASAIAEINVQLQE